MARLVSFWRLERANGQGVFMSGDADEALSAVFSYDDPRRSQFDPRRHPGPRCLGEYGTDLLGVCGGPREHVRFGVKSLKQYRQWFDHPAVRRALAERGVKLRKYRAPVDHVRYGNYQLSFDRRFAILIEERSPA